MKAFKGIVFAAIAAIGATLGTVQSSAAGDYNGDFMVRLQGTYLLTDDENKGLNSSILGDLSGVADTSTTNSWLPTATLTYFINKNVAVELFCCFGSAGIQLEDKGLGISGELGHVWMFPPALTLQYHFTDMGPFKPYLGVGAQWIHFFDEKLGDNVVGASKIDVDDAFGVTLQAGFDYEIGNGLYFNADVKKSFLNTEVTLHDALGIAGHTVTADHDLDPWIFSVGVGYRFNLFNRGPAAAYEPMK